MAVETIETLLTKKDALETTLDGFEKWVIFFGILVAVGVVGESVYGFRTWWNNRKLHATEQAIDELRQAQIVDARRDIAEAQRDAAQANDNAERERLARLQLEARLADRVLTAQQQATIATRLRAMGSRRIDILVVGNTPEISGLTNAIGAALHQAGWTIGNTGNAMGGSAAGVFVGFHQGSGPDIIQAADQLVASLRMAGIVTDKIAPYDDALPAALTGSWNTANTAPIRMIVGAKP